MHNFHHMFAYVTNITLNLNFLSFYSGSDFTKHIPTIPKSIPFKKSWIHCSRIYLWGSPSSPHIVWVKKFLLLHTIQNVITFSYIYFYYTVLMDMELKHDVSYKWYVSKKAFSGSDMEYSYTFKLILLLNNDIFWQHF